MSRHSQAFSRQVVQILCECWAFVDDICRSQVNSSTASSSMSDLIDSYESMLPELVSTFSSLLQQLGTSSVEQENAHIRSCVDAGRQRLNTEATAAALPPTASDKPAAAAEDKKEPQKANQLPETLLPQLFDAVAKVPSMRLRNARNWIESLARSTGLFLLQLIFVSAISQPQSRYRQRDQHSSLERVERLGTLERI